MRAPSFAVVDDDLEFCAVAGELARDYGFRYTGIHSVSDARTWLDSHVPDLMLVDIKLPDGSGYDVISGLRRRHKGQIVMVSGQASVEETAMAVRCDVNDFWIKPLHADLLEKLLRTVADEQRNRALSDPGPFGMVGSSRAMARLRQEMARIAVASGNVMIFGEPGTGKRLVARGLHNASNAQGELLSYDCALSSLGDGQFSRLQGLFESPVSSSIHLRNVDLLAVDAQRTLASLLDQHALAGTGARHRIISSSSEEVNAAAQRLHAGLFYRLCEHGIQVPSLRRRCADVLDLAEFFVGQHNLASGKHKYLDREYAGLISHQWPGNVRELATAVGRAYASASEVVRVEPLVLVPKPLAKPADPALPASEQVDAPSGELSIKVGSSMRAIELEVLKATIASCGGEKKAAARVLGITSRTVHNWLRREREGGDE